MPECPQFKFFIPESELVTGHPEEFSYNIFETELKITYNIETNMQTVKVKKIRNSNYNELFEFVFDVLTNQKTFVYSFFNSI